MVTELPDMTHVTTMTDMVCRVYVWHTLSVIVDDKAVLALQANLLAQIKDSLIEYSSMKKVIDGNGPHDEV